MKAKMNNYETWIRETDPNILYEYHIKLLKTSGFTMLGELSHHFEPYGYTLMFLLGESHLAIHTFPEENKTYIQLTSCVDIPFYKFIENYNMKEVGIN